MSLELPVHQGRRAAKARQESTLQHFATDLYAMPSPRLAASRPKSELFARLGLSEDNEMHRELYKRMKV